MNILITGGTGALGKAIIDTCASEDNKIFFTFCKKKEIEQEICRQYPNLIGLYVDFKDKGSLEELIGRIPDLQIDTLINNAWVGNPQGTHFHKTSIEDFENSFKWNILPLIQITQACLGGMRKRRFGKIINILTSYLIDVPPAGFSVYTASKACIRQLSKCICKEYSRYNITSNCILPDFMNTDFGHVEDFQLEQIVSEHPLKQLLKPKDVAGIVRDVLNSSQQLNGAEIAVNSAQHIM